MGQLYENISHLLILNSKSPFHIYRTGHRNDTITQKLNGDCKIDLTKLTCVRFNQKDFYKAVCEAKDNSYLRPIESNFPCVDAIVKLTGNKLLYLQMTVNSSHDISDKNGYFVKEALRLAKTFNHDDSIHIAFVIPVALFDKYVYGNLKIITPEMRAYPYRMCLPDSLIPNEIQLETCDSDSDPSIQPLQILQKN